MDKKLEEIFNEYWEGAERMRGASGDPDIMRIAEIIRDKDTPHEIADKCLLLFCPSDIIIAWRKRQFFKK